MVPATAFLVSACAVQPKPFTPEETAGRVVQDMAAMYADQEAVHGPITLAEASARALKYNLDHRLKLMEEAVALSELDLSHYDLLPRVTAEAGYHHRSNKQGTLVSPGNSQSVSTERIHNTADLEMTWNVLDFGVSYIRAQQKADMALMADERRRQVVHNILKDVRSAFWRVAAAERSLPHLDALSEKVQDALRKSEKLVAERLGNRVEHLTYQRALLDTLSQLDATRRDLLTARQNLAALMNLRPGTSYSVSLDGIDFDTPPTFPLTVEQAESIALYERAELRGEAYQTRVYAREAKVGILQMLPGLDFSVGAHYDDDRFLINSEWASLGSALTWNLLNVVRLPATLDLADRKVALSETRRMALSMAITSQVHVAALRNVSARHQFELAQRRREVEDQIGKASTAAREARRGSALNAIRDEVLAVQARLRQDLAYADVQDAYGALFATIGADPLPVIAEGPVTLAAATEALNRTFAAWQTGDLPEIDALVSVSDAVTIQSVDPAPTS
jgi:outer membrane protein TolC